MTRMLILTCLTLALGGCMRWSPRPVPVERAFATTDARDVAVRLVDDSTQWWRIRQAHLVGDTIVGVSKVGDELEPVAVPRDLVRDVVMWEPDRVADDALMQLGLMGSFLGLIVFIGTTWSLFSVKPFRH
jgi:hypothetical protein